LSREPLCKLTQLRLHGRERISQLVAQGISIFEKALLACSAGLLGSTGGLTGIPGGSTPVCGGGFGTVVSTVPLFPIYSPLLSKLTAENAQKITTPAMNVHKEKRLSSLRSLAGVFTASFSKVSCPVSDFVLHFAFVIWLIWFHLSFVVSFGMRSICPLPALLAGKYR
jgi:hypothetical protein